MFSCNCGDSYSKENPWALWDLGPKIYLYYGLKITYNERSMEVVF